jgi:hypothetical protein
VTIVSDQIGYSTVLIRTAVGAAFARFAICLLDVSEETDGSGPRAVSSGRQINCSASDGQPSTPTGEYAVV